MPIMFVTPGAIPTSSLADGTAVPLLGGKAGEVIDSNLHGKWYTQAYRGKSFFGTVTGVTIPAIASALVSVASLLNPSGSGVVLELISLTIGFTSATTVLDQIGLYWQAGSTFTQPTSITAGTVNPCKLGQGAGGGQWLTAGTHTGTPALLQHTVNMLTTSTVPPGQIFQTEYDGKFVLPPGSIVSVAASTAAWTASHTDLTMVWGESPI